LPRREPSQRNGKLHSHSTKLILDTDASTALRDQLLAELDAVTSSDDAASWAHQILGKKNGLTAADARQIEDAFQAKLAILQSPADKADGQSSAIIATPEASVSSGRQAADRSGRSIAEVIDKSQLTHPEPRRIRDKDHVRFVAKQPCLICGRRPSDPHHLRFAQHRALARKVSDEFTVPLCRGHHREVHRYGDEAAWWKKAGIDPTLPARSLWLGTHPLPTISDKMGIEGANLVADGGADQRNGKRDRPIGKRSSKCKTKPISSAPRV